MAIKTAIFHGPSGCGKDTQLDLLEKIYKFDRIGVSAVMAALKAENHEAAIRAAEYGKRGELYPDELVYEMLDIWVSRLEVDSNWFFGSPVRKGTQIVLFDELLAKHNRELDLFVHFRLSEEAAIERMSLRTYCPKCEATYHSKFKKEEKEGFCNNDGEILLTREDDKPEAIKKRLAWYQDDIDPILSEFEKRGILLEIDAAPSIEVIHKDLVQKMKEYEQRVR